MRLFYFVIEDTKICHELGKIAWFKAPCFQFYDYKTIQLAVEEQQIRKEIMGKCLKMILITYECKVLSECHYEFFDVVDNFFFHNALVNIFYITDSYFLCIYEIQ